MRLFWFAFLFALPAAAQDYRTSLIKWEGLRLASYRDHGAQCVGIGHNLTARGQAVRNYSRAEIEALFQSDLREALQIAHREVADFDDLPDDVKLVTVNVIWTVGGTGFHRFINLRRALSRQAFTAAATELYLSKWFRTVQAPRANWAVNTLRSH